MNTRKIMMGMAAVVCALAGTAFGTDYRSVGTGDWSDNKSWDQWNGSAWVGATGVPGSGDTAQIRSVGAITVSANTSVGTLTIDSGAALTINSSTALTVSGNTALGGTATINSSGTLTVGGAASLSGTVIINSSAVLTVNGGGGNFAGTLTINGGSVVFAGSTPTDVPASSILLVNGSAPTITVNNTNALRLPSSGSTLVIGSSCLINGSGSVQGKDNGALIEICPIGGTSAVTLTNNAIIRGAMKIELNPSAGGGAQANFANTHDGSRIGVVAADFAGGTLDMDSTLNTISDDSFDACSAGEHWGVNADGAVLQFDRAATGLAGSFYVGSAGASPTTLGTLQINANVTTSASGKLDFAHGRVIVANGSTFTFGGGYCGSSLCSATSSPFTGPVTVSCP